MTLRIDTTLPPTLSHRGTSPAATTARASRDDAPGAPHTNGPAPPSHPTDPVPPPSAEAAAALARLVAEQLAAHGETAVRAQGNLAAGVVCRLLQD